MSTMPHSMPSNSGIPTKAETLLREVYLSTRAAQSVDSISSTATADSLDGAGRTLGKLYTYLGRRLENALNKCMARIGCGPEACKRRLMKKRSTCMHCDWFSSNLVGYIPFPNSAEDRRCRKEVRKLIKYTSSNITTNQYQAYDAIIELSIHDTYLRQLLVTIGAPKAVALQTIRLQEEPDRELDHLLASAQRALICLLEVDINCAGQKTGLLYKSIWIHSRTSGGEAKELQWRDLSAFLDTVTDLIQYSIQSPASSFLALRHLGRAPLFSGFESLFEKDEYPYELREKYNSVPVSLANAFLYLLDNVAPHLTDWQSFGWLLWVFALYSRGIEERMQLARKIAYRSWQYLPPHVKRNLADLGPCKR
ncbi:uncharacterized protein FOMMEDRAFT_151551 [Fomitiporia mediterranea MF3/22]|uniref:uncharacterized protein n=1 Tax=Fomitiporia mediterranea (strain MF3/22) TaxID=694068 RepID=UPI0004409C56|nr:uncharacterized protein FOMMEDRAFT_151551 [Fomitiporia mediterranea MF3/22]EJD06318.1 hypothetical protein FOMMEDRAFT_151551 [Fomitiporia mediterranea MF3/22]